MLKILGAILILLGTAGGIVTWMKEEQKCLLTLQELRQFYIRVYYAMDIEKVQMTDFLEEYNTNLPALSAWKDRLTQALRANTYPSGEAAFAWALEETKEMWNISKEGWEVFGKSAKGLFGMNLPENLVHLQRARKDMEECLKEQKMSYVKKRKLVIPVTVLGAVMIIICLL